MGPRCSPSAIYLRRQRFAYLRLMKQGFNFLPPEINITLLEQMGGGRMGSMKTRHNNGAGSAAEWPEVIKLRNFHTAGSFLFYIISIYLGDGGGRRIRIKWHVRRLDSQGFVCHTLAPCVIHTRCKVCDRRCAKVTELQPRPQKVAAFPQRHFAVRRLCWRLDEA